jgi:hypothetical protein
MGHKWRLREGWLSVTGALTQDIAKITLLVANEDRCGAT